jgi:hypothetical protein
MEGFKILCSCLVIIAIFSFFMAIYGVGVIEWLAAKKKGLLCAILFLFLPLLFIFWIMLEVISWL